MAENEANFPIRRVDSAQIFIKQRYSETIGLATSILGQVLLGTIRGTKRSKEVIKLCLKDMRDQFSDRVAEDPRMEIEFMNEICNVGHPNFVSFIDAVEDNKLYAICLEYVSGGDMCTYIQNIRCGIDNGRSKQYALQLTKAVYFMHKKGYCHLDLSLENVLWDKKNDVLKLCDFGLCRKFPNGDISANFNAATIRPGKKGYMSPEIYAYQRFNGEKADVFSLGVLIFILLTGFPPFNTPNASDKCFQYIYYGKLEWLLKQWKLNDIINEKCRSLLSKIFCHPKKRINIKEMLQHPWFDQNINDIDQEIHHFMNDNDSLSAGDVKEEQQQSPSISVVPAIRSKKKEKKEKKEKEASIIPSTTTTTTTISSTSATKKRKSITTIVKKKRLSSKSNKKQTKDLSSFKKKTKKIRRGSVSSIREESPASTLSNHSNHSNHSIHSNHSNQSNQSQQSHQDDYKQTNHHHTHSNDANMRDATSPLLPSQSHSSSSLNDTQLITSKYNKNNANKQKMNNYDNNNGNFNNNNNNKNKNNKNHNDFGDNDSFDNDRKEGDYETYPDPYYHERNSIISQQDEERRLSITSQDAGSVHSDSHHLDNNHKPNHNKPNDNNHKSSISSSTTKTTTTSNTSHSHPPV